LEILQSIDYISSIPYTLDAPYITNDFEGTIIGQNNQEPNYEMLYLVKDKSQTD
jgi:hypothetical protein